VIAFAHPVVAQKRTVRTGARAKPSETKSRNLFEGPAKQKRCDDWVAMMQELSRIAGLFPTNSPEWNSAINAAVGLSMLKSNKRIRIYFWVWHARWRADRAAGAL